MHGSESASGKRQIAQFLCAFWDKQTFTRGVRVARVPQGVETAGLEVQGEGNPAKPLVNYGLFGPTYMGSLFALKGLSLSS